MQGDVGHTAGKDGIDVYTDGLVRTVGLQAQEHGMVACRLRQQSAGLHDKRHHGGDVGRNLITAWTYDCPLHLSHVHIVGGGAVGCHHVTVGKEEGGEIVGRWCEHHTLAVSTTLHPQGGPVGIFGEHPRGFQCLLQTLAGTHFVPHRAFHLTTHLHQLFVGTYNDDIAVAEHDVPRQTSMKDIVINVDIRHNASVPHHLDGAERSDFSHTACHIEGMEDGGKRTEGVTSGYRHLAHHMNADGTGLSDAHTDGAAGIERGEAGTEGTAGGRKGQPSQRHRSRKVEHDDSVGRDGMVRGMVASTVDIDVDFVAGSQDIVIGDGNIDVGFKTEHPQPENVMTENLPSVGIMLPGKMFFDGGCAGRLPVVCPQHRIIAGFLLLHFSALLLHVQLLHVALYALQLVGRSTARQKLIGDGLGFGALFVTLTDEFRHLYVGQPLCCRGEGCKKQYKGEEPL